MLARLPLVFAVGAALAGCGASAPARFYTLDAVARPDGTPPASYAVVVGPVSVPASVDRPQFVVQVAPNRVTVDEFNRWVAPLDDGVARAVASNLAVLLGSPRVAAAPVASLNPAYRVTIAVQRFDTIPEEGVIVEAVWTVRDAVDGDTRSGRTVAHETVQGEGFDVLAAAHSRAIAALSSDVAAAIRALAAERKPPPIAPS